jgi:hypothetical protein
MRLILASQAGAPSLWYLVLIRSGSGGDIPSSAGVERRSQLLLSDGVRAGIGTIVTEAQHVEGSIVLGHRRETRRVC